MKLAVKIEPNLEKLNAIKKCEYACVEIYTSEKFIKPEFVQLLNQFDFEYAVHSPIEYCDESVFDFAKNIDAKIVTIHCSYPLDQLYILCNIASSMSIQLCLENEGVCGDGNFEDEVKKPGELETIRSGSDFIELVKKIPNLGLTYDTEHAMICKTTDTFWNLFEKNMVRHIHTSGYDYRKGSWHTPPLNFENNFKNLIEKLVGYTEMLTIEMDTNYHTEDIFKQHMEFYRNYAPN